MNVDEELRVSARELLDWIERTDGNLFRPDPALKRGRVDVDATSANQEHNEQVRNAIERLRTACGPGYKL